MHESKEAKNLIVVLQLVDKYDSLAVLFYTLYDDWSLSAGVHKESLK
jgi:hypothetical protein